MVLKTGPLDGGPIYTETHFGNLFPEPFNTLTSFLFTLLSLFWLLKLRKDFQSHMFLGVCVIILLIGSIGGTLYHGLRRYPIFLFMDYMPIMILCFLAGFYFLWRSFEKKYWAFFIWGGFLLCIFETHFIFSGFPRQYQISLNYALMALMVMSSTLVFLNKIKYQYTSRIVQALIFFSMALFFRISDPRKWIPIGTHFLWHIFGMLATASMLWFIYQTDNLSRSLSEEEKVW